MKEFHASVMAVFRRLVRDTMQQRPPTVLPETPCGEALRMMRDFAAEAMVVVSAEGHPIGLLTQEDVVEKIAYLVPAGTPVRDVMRSPVETIHDDDYLFHGMGLMNRSGLSRLPVVDRNGRLTGILRLRDALSGAMTHVMDLTRRLTHEETVSGLKLIREAQVAVANGLLEDGIPVTDIQMLLTHINNDIHRRAQSMILKDLAEEGWGEPPASFDIIVMGSGGRGESFLHSDQDYGFILMDYPARHHSMVDTYFAEVAKRMSAILDTVGIPICRGNVMAGNPQWRKSLSQWCRQVEGWIEEPDHTTLRYADIFFDFRHVSGHEPLATSLRRHVSRLAPRNHVFLREMQKVQDAHGVALGAFGRLIPEPDPPHQGRVNLKYQGLLPLVEAVRLLALREGLEPTSTMKRMDTLTARGALSRDEHDYLTGAFRHLTAVILRQQIEDFRAGLEVTPYVKPDALSSRERENLVDSLRAIAAFRRRLRSEITGEVF